MNFNVQYRNTDKNLRLTLSGQFDFNANKAFRHACEEGLKVRASGSIELDFSEVEYMDSSALGMLLLFKDRAGPMDEAIRLINCPESIREILEVVKFEKLFSIP